MKFFILTLIIFSIKSIDVCIQLTTYDHCIGIQDQQCMWNGSQCRGSKNYLLGCSPNLSQKLCLKQFGESDGVVSECIFDGICHIVFDKYNLICTDKLSKSGCLAITNPDQLCKWENGSCQNLSSNEINNINTIFPDYELSASVCSVISGYLIIHHTLLWNLVDYKPDLILEAENLVKKESGIEVDSSQSYDVATLQDNYIKTDGTFAWYTEQTSLTPWNLKINNVSRYGCIAQEILNSSRFLMLFNLSGTIRGVNHIYCKYYSQHPTNPTQTIFINHECQTVTESQLQNQDFINENSIVCKNMSGLTCQRFYKSNYYCKIDYTQEYQCQQVQTLESHQSCNEIDVGTATHYACVSISDSFCFLDTSNTKFYCNPACNQSTNQSDCVDYSQCQWIGSNLQNISDAMDSQFLVCVPINGCDQLGLSQQYCQNMAMNCYWDETIKKCSSISNISLLKCSDCNNSYCCSSITMNDQFCVWNLNKCLNVKDQNLFSHYLSFPTQVIMNLNLCVNQVGQYNYYDYKTRSCSTTDIDEFTVCVDFVDVNFLTDNFECNNSQIAASNKEYCLNLIYSLTKWDIFKQKCIHVTNTSIHCDDMVQVNQNLCREAIVESNKICLYNEATFSCYSTSISTKINCNTKGINQTQCVTISDENCIWFKNQCSYIEPYQIVTFTCSELQKVSQNVCRFVIKNKEMCQYDSTNFGCKIIYSQNSACNQFSNLYACVQTDNSCYFDDIEYLCKDSTLLLNILQCTMNVTEKTCINITTQGQRCYWGPIPQDSTSKCRQYKEEFYSQCDTYGDESNTNLCEALQSSSVLQIIDNQYCEVVNQDCQSALTPITDSDCGYTRQINLFRCMAYTTQKCYFDNYKCKLLDGPTQYQNLILNQISCDQSNMQLCNKITTPSQVCYKYDSRKCLQLFYTFSATCAELSKKDMTIYGPQLCTRASDSCVYDAIQQKCVIPSNASTFQCNQIGLSQISCRTKTIGLCAFIDYYCQDLTDLNTNCEYRNIMGCTIGLFNCIWDSTLKICKLSTDICPSSYDNGSDWPVCQISSGFCFAGRGGCASPQSYLPCWLSLSNVLCNFQNGFCQWIDNKCTDGIYNCEDAKTIQECVLHRSKNCVYDNGICFEIQDFDNYSCQYFEYTTDTFCRNYHPLCVYSETNFTCQRVNYIGDSHQFDSSQSITNCNSLTTQSYCILQRNLQCVFKDNTCQLDQNIITQCPYFDTVKQPSMLSCESLTNCAFSITRTGYSFCYIEPITCEQLNSDFCLEDIPGIMCYFDLDASNCKTYIDDITCSKISSLLVNNELCIQANELDTQNNCYYVRDTKSCKMEQRIILQDCSFAVNLYLCTFVELPCQINFDLNNDYQSCTSTTTYNINNNLISCTSLIGKLYYFNLNTHQCLKFTNQLNSIYLCQQLNFDSCTQIQSNIQCIWFNNKCIKYSAQYIDVECQYRNINSCIKDHNKPCIWVPDTQQCSIGSSVAASCENGTYSNCVYSESYCKSVSKLWTGQQCYAFTTNLPESFFSCQYLGLNQQLCINNTNKLFCYWNGQSCFQANLKTIKCTDTVSQQTCLKIITPQQACNWQGGQCVNMIASQNCNDFPTLYACRQANISCEFNTNTQTCEKKDNYNQFCSNSLSFGACAQVENQYCIWLEGHCNYWTISKFSCTNIVNKWGCMNSQMTCYWINGCFNISKDFTSFPCQTLPAEFNKVSCKFYSIDPCEFDEKEQICNIELLSTTQASMQTDQSGYLQIKLFYECTDFTKQSDCIGSRIKYCEWQNDSCIDCSTNNACTQNCSNKSIKQCLKSIDLYCAWRDNSCVEWIYNSQQKLESLTLITQKCCQLYNIPIKYDSNLSSCVQLNYDIDNCNVQSISEQGCYKIKNFQCIYLNGTCQTYIFEKKNNCDDYANISQKVCQQLPHLSCKFDKINHKCINSDSTNDHCDTIGLSLYGCTEIQTEPCQWDSDLQSCSPFILQMGINQCDNFTYRNYLSCSIMNYYFEVCSFNKFKRTCHQKFNKYFTCSTNGLNYYACVNLVLEPCIYINSKCQKLQQLTDNCYDLQNVNEMTCKLNTLDRCAYDPIKHNCFFTLTQLPCSYKGLNTKSCSLNNNCNWSSDLAQCQCNSLTQSNSCSLSQANCLSNSNCIYDTDLKYCRVKTCYDLTECTGSMNGKICYLDSTNQCQSASVCEDIINLNAANQCSDFVINLSNCIQFNLSYCVSFTNLEEICSNSDCSNTSCKLDNYNCRPLSCQDYKEDDCFNQNNCSYINNECQSIQSCSVITDQLTCIQTTFNNVQCSWEYYGVFENVKQCTNRYCKLYNLGSSLCNGNEINQYSCFMDQFQRCQICEEIDDQCTCENSEGSCAYSNHKCVSILCSQYLSSSTCEKSSKCYWSSTDYVCRKMCKYLIFQIDCEALDYECHWNQYQLKCEQGVYIEPDLSVKITVQDISTTILNSIIILLIIIF